MRRGRPRLAADDGSVNVHFRLPAKQYDAAQKRAERERLTLSGWFRRAVTRACKAPTR